MLPFLAYVVNVNGDQKISVIIFGNPIDEAPRPPLLHFGAKENLP